MRAGSPLRPLVAPVALALVVLAAAVTFAQGDGTAPETEMGREAPGVPAPTECDWVRNVLTSKSFAIDRRGTIEDLHNVRLVPRSEAWPHLPALVRVAMRILRVEWYVRGDS